MRFPAPLAVLTFSLLAASPALRPVWADDITTHLQKAKTAVDAKNWDGALAELDAAVALDANNISAHTGRAVMLAQKQDIPGALAAITRVIELAPRNAGAFNMRAGLYRRAGDATKAQDDYVSFLRLSPDDLTALIEAAQTATTKADRERAANLWTMLALVKPDDAATQYGRGMALLAYAPDALLAGLLRGDVDAANKVRADAEACFRAAIKADPKFAPAYLHVEDSEVLAQGLKLMPTNADLVVAQGNLLLAGFPSKEDTETALADFNRALQLDPKSASALAGLARIYFWREEYDQSLLASARSLEIDPSNFETLMLRASVFNNKRDYESAVAEYDRALALRPNNQDANYARFFDLSQLPDKTKALETVDKLMVQFPNEGYRQMRADLLFTMKEFAKALVDVDKILGEKPDDKRAQELRAKIVAALG